MRVAGPAAAAAPRLASAGQPHGRSHRSATRAVLPLSWLEPKPDAPRHQHRTSSAAYQALFRHDDSRDLTRPQSPSDARTVPAALPPRRNWRGINTPVIRGQPFIAWPTGRGGPK